MRGTGYNEGRRVAGAQLLIDVVAADAAVPRLREDESYRLFVTADKAMLSAHTASGAARGLETFLQLLQARRSVAACPDRSDVPGVWRGRAARRGERGGGAKPPPRPAARHEGGGRAAAARRRHPRRASLPLARRPPD